jgi:hypothetical protein
VENRRSVLFIVVLCSSVRTKELPRECATNTIWYLQGDVLLKVAEIWKLAKACVEDTVVVMTSVNGVRRMAAQELLRKEGSVTLMVKVIKDV